MVHLDSGQPHCEITPAQDFLSAFVHFNKAKSGERPTKHSAHHLGMGALLIYIYFLKTVYLLYIYFLIISSVSDMFQLLFCLLIFLSLYFWRG